MGIMDRFRKPEETENPEDRIRELEQKLAAAERKNETLEKENHNLEQKVSSMAQERWGMDHALKESVNVLNRLMVETRGRGLTDADIEMLGSGNLEIDITGMDGKVKEPDLNKNPAYNKVIKMPGSRDDGPDFDME